ncbi:fumarylacetoacetate hydrolase [Exidia glandulosa HHB12029]|uniref:Fumarylacetoacetate hydrolase n=1 Tax=Exidia glandulosa HHB12029 TaxID=1314781 RepID=A0A165QWL3_EXIGL|nr:fumarylacetoacetate hydrolase [Exidia glandulosa HHB12029]
MWKRLIRFEAAEDGAVHIGQPVDAQLDVGLAFSKNETIKAHEISGSALDPGAQVTDKVLTVKKLLAPLSREQVGLVRCLGLNYKDHAAEAKMQAPANPVLFYKPVQALIGPCDDITIPKALQPVDFHLPDFEAELTIVIGKPCKNVSEADALDYVLGYTLANDMSFRHHQMAVSQWSFSKGFDDASPWGPCIVSAREIPDPQTLYVKTDVNGKSMQDGNTSDQIFTVRTTIAFLSQGTTLPPGSIIMTGTPKGVGFVRQPAVFLKDGDVVHQSMGGGIGSIVNKIVEEK